MTFKEAKERLDIIAGDRYHSIRFEVSENPKTGTKRAECSFYVDGWGVFTAPTWASASQLLEGPLFTDEEIPPVEDMEVTQ